MTIRHLLTHTSGIDIADDFTDTGDGDDCLERYLHDVVVGSDLIEPVGGRWSYSNGAYSILGRLLEVATGTTWDAVIDERVLAPTGMAATTIRRGGRTGQIVHGHRADEHGVLVTDDRAMPSSAGPAGNVVTDVASLVRFASALLVDQTLVPPDLVAEAVRPQAAMRHGSYGFGWTIPAAGVVTHGGSTIGQTAFLGCVPALGGALAVAANGPGAGLIALAVQNEIYGVADVTADPAGPADQLELGPASSTLVGHHCRRHVEVVVEIDEDGLIATILRSGAAADLFGDEPTVRLHPAGGARFTSVRPDGRGTDEWEFLDIDRDGRSTVLRTERIHRRAD